MLIGKNVKDLEADDLDATASLKGTAAGQEEVVVRPKIEQLPEGVTASVHDLKVHLIPLDLSTEYPKRKSGK